MYNTLIGKTFYESIFVTDFKSLILTCGFFQAAFYLSYVERKVADNIDFSI